MPDLSGAARRDAGFIIALLRQVIMSNLHPEKIYVELTTRCNLRCRMCVKYAAGSCIAEEDLPFAVFRGLAPALTNADTLILNGIGEPLLRPELEGNYPSSFHFD
jgi:MoaA/NifB/PqqE/SkfB family radical SAM enzyme